MTIVFHAMVYGRFIERQSNLRRKKLHRMNQGSNFLGGAFNKVPYLKPLGGFKVDSACHTSEVNKMSTRNF